MRYSFQSSLRNSLITERLPSNAIRQRADELTCGLLFRGGGHIAAKRKQAHVRGRDFSAARRQLQRRPQS